MTQTVCIFCDWCGKVTDGRSYCDDRCQDDHYHFGASDIDGDRLAACQEAYRLECDRQMATWCRKDFALA